MKTTCPECGAEFFKSPRNPFPTVDGIILKQDKILLIERRNPPFGWALPGGFIDYGESCENAVIREVKEETGLDFLNPILFRVYSRPDRDPRFHTISLVFYGEWKGIIRAGDDALRAKFFPLTDLPEDMAFDHRQIITNFFQQDRTS